MARSTRTKSTAPVAEVEETETAETETTAEVTPKSVINEGIGRVIEATGIDVQKNRYKAMRAIAYQAFANAIEDGTFDQLVTDAIANVDSLPAGWEIERSEKAEPVAKPAAKPAAKASTAKAAPAKKAPAAKATEAKPAARKRPTR